MSSGKNFIPFLQQSVAFENTSHSKETACVQIAVRARVRR